MRKLLLLFVLLSACGEEDTKLAATQITLTVDADGALTGKLDNLRATLFANANGSWTRRSSVDVPVSSLRWPLDIPILARPGDESAQIEVIVEAYAKEQRLAQARVITRFTRDRITVTTTHLYECAGRSACAQDSCHGEGCEVCSPSGDCVAVTPTETLDAGTVQEDKDAGVVVDAGNTVQDTGTTPPVETDAATTPPDAGTPNACPANACMAPYPCAPTAAGYTCRGQFADWPMPDNLPGAKVKPSYTATPDVVTDNVTKLMWQSGLPPVYPGCTEFFSWSDGTKGPKGELCTRAQAKDYCDSLKHGDFDDWRLPTAIELLSLLDLTRENPDLAIEPNVFADAEDGPFVSASTYAGGPSQTWGVNYWNRATYYDAQAAAAVRCVRAGAEPSFATPADRYTTTGEQVTDRATGLIWQRGHSANKFALEASDAGLPLVGTACTAPWRLPTINELLTLVDFTRSKPAIQTEVFPNTPSDIFFGGPTDYDSAVNFETGGLRTYEDFGYVRCVQ